MRAGFLVLLVLSWGSTILASPFPHEGDDVRLDTPPSNFIGEGTNELATALLQGFVEEDKDFVYSPLGYSVILALMAEGARGETHKQLVTALNLPEDTYAVRQNYKAVLESMREKWAMNKPEFKNWFYVYKNYTVNDAYKQVLLENYLTEVKQVDKVHYELSFENEDSTDIADNKNVTSETSTETVSKENSTETRTEEGKEGSEEENRTSTYEGNKDVASALTASRVIGPGTTLDEETKMIVFNGLYFRGVWKTPFQLTKEDNKRIFYKSISDKKQVSMMQTSGNFNIGSIPELDAQALELPYEGDQYSMMVLLPNQRDGLNKLISDITGFSLNKVYKYLVDRQVEVCLPKYQIQTISHPEEILKKYGVFDVFTDLADLSGISSDKLKMGALVQLVNFQVDEGMADTNFLTTLNTKGPALESMTGEFRNNVEKFVADHPFLFFVRDHTRNVILTAGKVIDPKFYSNEDLAP